MNKKSIVQQAVEADAAEAAKQTLQKAREKRVKDCSIEISEALKKYNCDFQVRMILEPSRNIPEVSIIAKD